MYQITDSTDDFWWFWTAFYHIVEATVITCVTHIVSVSFADGFIVLLLCMLYFFCTYTFVLYFILTEAWYESTGRNEPIDELYL